MTVVSVKVKRTDMGVKSLKLPSESLEPDVDVLKTFLSESLEVRAEDAPYKVFKLRDAEGAFIPLTHILRAEDLQEGPCQLEVVNCRQTTLLGDHLHNLTLLKNSLKNRVDHLEACLLVRRTRSRSADDGDVLAQVHELSTQLRNMSDKIDSMEASTSSTALIQQ